MLLNSEERNKKSLKMIWLAGLVKVNNHDII